MSLMAATAAVAAATKAEEEADAAEAGHLLLDDVDFLLDGGSASFIIDGGSASFVIDGGASSKRKAACPPPCSPRARKRRVTAGRCLDVVLRATTVAGRLSAPVGSSQRRRAAAGGGAFACTRRRCAAVGAAPSLARI